MIAFLFLFFAINLVVGLALLIFITPLYIMYNYNVILGVITAIVLWPNVFNITIMRK